MLVGDCSPVERPSAYFHDPVRLGLGRLFVTVRIGASALLLPREPLCSRGSRCFPSPPFFQGHSSQC